MSNANPVSNAKRRAELGPDEIERMSEELAEISTGLRATADSMRHMGIKSALVDGVMKFANGRELLVAFEANVLSAVKKARPAKSATPKKAASKK